MIEIIADVYERRSGIAERLRALGWSVEERVLEVSDYVLGALIGIERKTVTDFVTSVTRGRLFRQLAELKTSVHQPLLLIEGDRSGLMRLHPNVVRGVLVKVSVGWSVPILWSQDGEESAALIHTMAKQATLSQSIPRRVSVKKAEEKPTTQRQLLAQIPRIGPGNATALLDQFGSLENILAASAKQLQAVEGIGVRKASLIYDTLHEPGATYRV